MTDQTIAYLLLSILIGSPVSCFVMVTLNLLILRRTRKLADDMPRAELGEDAP